MKSASFPAKAAAIVSAAIVVYCPGFSVAITARARAGAPPGVVTVRPEISAPSAAANTHRPSASTSAIIIARIFFISESPFLNQC